MSKEKQQNKNRIELLVESIAVQKQVIDETCDELITAKDTGNDKKVKENKKLLAGYIKKYNNTVSEYNKEANTKVELLSEDLPNQIEAGKSFRGVAPLGKTSKAVSTNAYTSSVKVTNKKELADYFAKSDKALDNVRARLSSTVDNKNGANGYNKVLLIINCLTYQRYIVERLSENLAVCNGFQDEKGKKDNKKVAQLKKLLTEEIANYNKFVHEYHLVTGSNLTPASDTIPDCIIEGKPYPAIPAISYSANDGAVRNSDAEVAAVAARAAQDLDKAKKKAKKAKKNNKNLEATALESKTKEQAVKDVKTVAKYYEFLNNYLDSEKDMTKYKFGTNAFDMKEVEKEINKKKKENSKIAEKAVACENADNERYYSIILSDPGCMEIKKRNPNRGKLASLRTEMMALLNARDEINSKLLAIYDGTEVNLDGSCVNKEWRLIKSDAAKKCINKNKKLAKTIDGLKASNAEKSKLYTLMNQNVDAASTKAVCAYRIKNDKMVDKAEKKQLNADIKNCDQLIKYNTDEINHAIKGIKKRG